jgi:DNA-directed RNA polymerase specialized sigma24 family protein
VPLDMALAGIEQRMMNAHCTITSAVTATRSMDLYQRLMRYASKFVGRDKDAAHEGAMAGVMAWLTDPSKPDEYFFVVSRNYIFDAHRNRRIRGEGESYSLDDEGNEPLVLKWAVYPATQELRLCAIECVDAIRLLSDKNASVLNLAAQEYDAKEICDTLRITYNEMRGRLAEGRKVLRQREGYEVEHKRGHRQFIGIRKQRGKWHAQIVNKHIGSFDTAAQAAAAYDMKAKEVFGAEARLNFPR